MSAATQRETSGKIFLKLFKVEGVVHPLREILRLGGISFDSEEIPVDKYMKMKDQLPYLKLPVMKLEDGEEFAEPPALLHYLAQRANLISSEPRQAMKTLEICNALTRISEMYKMSLELKEINDNQNSERTIKLLNEEIMPHYFRKIETDLKSGSDKCDSCGDICKCGAVCSCGPKCVHRYLVGKKLSVADVTLKCLVDSFRQGKLQGINTEIFKKVAPDLDQYWYNNIKSEMDNLLGMNK